MVFDLVIQGGQIVDGSGAPWFLGDVGVRGDRIGAIGQLKNAPARKRLDATGKVVCPGFIDMHTHSDIMILVKPKHEAKVLQGVTTDLLGLDGLSYAPLSPRNMPTMRKYLRALNGDAEEAGWDWSSVGEYLQRVDRRVAANVAYLVPHGALRLEAVGFVDRPATPEEISRMKELLARGLGEGAVGFSTGLDYFPCRYASTEELEELCKTVAEHGGLSVWHSRVRDLGLIGAIEEVLSIADKTGVKVHFSHFSANGPANKGKSAQMLALIDEARARGIDVTFDSYPYDASSTTMVILLPRWVHEGGPEAILRRLGDKRVRDRICRELRESGAPWDKLVLTSASKPQHRGLVGKSLLEGARIQAREVEELVCDLLLEEELNVGYVSFLGNEEDIRAIMRHPCHTLCSDGILVGDRPHPRAWGAFARFLAVYVRQLGILSLEEAIRHMTSVPAQRLGLVGRGLLRPGFAADLVVFDPLKVVDTATFDCPVAHPRGIDHVVVNGALVVDSGTHTGVIAGRALGPG